MHSLELINYEALNNETNLGAKSDIYRYEASFYLSSNCQATGTGTWDLGPGTWDLGPGTWDLGPGT